MTRDAVDKLFDTISPRYGDREGGYLRIVHGGFRKGDGGEIAFVELLGSEDARREAPRSAPKFAPSAPKKTARPWKRRPPKPQPADVASAEGEAKPEEK